MQAVRSSTSKSDQQPHRHEFATNATTDRQPRSWLPDFAALALAAGLTVLVMFLLWEFIERRYGANQQIIYLMHYARGISSSLVTATVVAWIAFGQHRARLQALNAEIRHRTHELEQARAFLQLVFDNTPASLVVLDKDMKVVKANRAAEQLHGIDPAGLPCHVALAGEDEMCAECPAEETMVSGASVTMDGEHRDPRTGEVLAIQSHRLELPDGENLLLVVENRITEQRKLQARVLHQEKMAAFGLLAAGVAHDMGNPLASIAAQLQLLDDDTLRDDVREVVVTLRQESERLRRILRELVDFARRRRDEASLVSVQAVVEDAVRLLRHDKRMRPIEILEDFDPEVEPVFMVEDHLMQVVTNLLINAVDAMPDGGSLRIEIKPAPEQVALRIHDSGHGMERTVLQRCFEPLFTTKEPGRGTGLGLSICRDLLQATGGDLELHSAPGQGTTAVVILPAAREEVA